MEEIRLTDFFQTKQEANDLSNALANFSEEIYRSEFNAEKSLAKIFGVEKRDKFIRFLKINNINLEDKYNLKEFVDKIQKKISELPIVHLKIAFEPKESTLKQVSEWFLINLQKQIIIDVLIDKNILAGTIINYDGKHFDLSVKNRFSEIISETIEKNDPLNAKKPSNEYRDAKHLNVGGM